MLLVAKNNKGTNSRNRGANRAFAITSCPHKIRYFI